MVGADVLDGLVNHPLKLDRGNIGESFAGVPNGLMKSSMNFEMSPF